MINVPLPAVTGFGLSAVLTVSVVAAISSATAVVR